MGRQARHPRSVYRPRPADVRDAQVVPVISTPRGMTSVSIDESVRLYEPGAAQTMPFARPHFDKLLLAQDFVTAKDHAARVEHAAAVVAETDGAKPQAIRRPNLRHRGTECPATDTSSQTHGGAVLGRESSARRDRRGRESSARRDRRSTCYVAGPNLRRRWLSAGSLTGDLVHDARPK